MTRTAFDTLLGAFRDLHAATPALQEFCAMHSVPAPQPVAPHHIPAADLMKKGANLAASPATAALRDAFIAAGPHAQWRETYKGTSLGEVFRERFGCYCLIGDGGPFASNDMSAYFVHLPASFHYPFHHHSAEEIYFVLAGQAEFELDGQPPETLAPGDHVFHPSNHPHATTTGDLGMMALVLLRGDLETRPVWTYPESIA